MASVILKNIVKVYPSGVKAIDDFSLEIKDGECVALLGLEASGKTTLLRMIAGLESINEGELIFDNKDVTAVSVKDRDVLLVAPNIGLDNNATVAENMAYSLKIRKMPQATIDAKVNAVAKMMNLSNLLLKKPKQLTAIERQRVAFSRSLLREAKVCLFDSPYNGLDEKLRSQIFDDLLQVHSRLKMTMIYATQSVAQAMMIADRIAIIRFGKLEQFDIPQNIYAHPANDFVKELLKIKE